MSAAPAKSADPSMEEILASIRRIIADDDETKVQEPEPQPTGPAASLDEPADDVLDLATMDPPGESDTGLEIDLPDLSFRPAGEVEPEAEPSQPDAGDLAAALAAQFRDAVAPEPMAPEPELPPPSLPPPPLPPPARSAESLISHEATASVGQAFNLLSHTIMSQNAHTLEDLVREMLKPMLKTWLDDNLPPLVERLVAAEIQRVARGQR